MNKLGLILLFLCGIISVSKAQQTIEEQVADSACACLNTIDTVRVKSMVEVIENLGHEKILCVKILDSETLFYVRVNSEVVFKIGELVDIFFDVKKSTICKLTSQTHYSY